MERLGGENIGERAPMKRVAGASFIGTAIEYYDYFIYATAAALIFPTLFFPEFSPLAGTLAAFAAYGSGFVARPLGAAFFGHFGDKVGRKAMLVMTIVIMGLATALIGVLPTFESIGLWAAALLVVMRLLQGFSAGGEWGGAALVNVEHSPEGRRGFYGGTMMIGLSVGQILATGVFTLFATLPEEQFLAWGWRIPFLLSIVLVAVGLFVRLRITETPTFQRVKDTRTEFRMPLVETIRSYPRAVLLTVGATFLFSMFMYLLTVFVLSYGTQQLALPRGLILGATLICSAIQIPFILGFGALSDRVGRRPVMLAGAAFTLVYAFPMFALMNTGNPVLFVGAMVIGFIGITPIFGPLAALVVEAFDTRIRYTGASLGYQLGSTLGGGTAPFIAVALVGWSGGATWPVALYIVVGASISLFSIYLLAETSKRNLAEDQLFEEPLADAPGKVEA